MYLFPRHYHPKLPSTPPNHGTAITIISSRPQAHALDCYYRYYLHQANVDVINIPLQSLDPTKKGSAQNHYHLPPSFLLFLYLFGFLSSSFPCSSSPTHTSSSFFSSFLPFLPADVEAEERNKSLLRWKKEECLLEPFAWKKRLTEHEYDEILPVVSSRKFSGLVLTPKFSIFPWLPGAH